MFDLCEHGKYAGEPCEPCSRKALASASSCTSPSRCSADADIFECRACQLRDVAQWLDLNGQKDLGRQVRDLAAKVYEIAIEKRKANAPALPPQRSGGRQEKVVVHSSSEGGRE